MLDLLTDLKFRQTARFAYREINQFSAEEPYMMLSNYEEYENIYGENKTNQKKQHKHLL